MFNPQLPIFLDTQINLDYTQKPLPGGLNTEENVNRSGALPLSADPLVTIFKLLTGDVAILQRLVALLGAKSY